MKKFKSIISALLITILLLMQSYNWIFTADCYVKAGGHYTRVFVLSESKDGVVAGVTEGLAGAAEDVGRQMIVEGKSLKEVDYGQAMKTGAISGLSGAGGELFGSLNEVRKASSRNIRKAATKEIKKDAGEELSERLTKNSDKNLAKKAKEIKSISSGTGAISDKGTKSLSRSLKTSVKDNVDNLDSLPKGTIQSVKSGIDADDYAKKAAKNADVMNGSKKVGKGGSSSDIDRIKKVAQQSYDYAVNNPRQSGLNRMQLGKDAEVQATRWTRKWAKRNGIDLSEEGLHFQVRGNHSIPDVVYEPTKSIMDFKLTPKAIRKVQSDNFKLDFPDYSIEYIFGPGPWRDN